MRTPRVLVPVTVLVLLGGCGGNPGPAEWAATVCTALTPWRTEIGSLTERAQNQMTAATTAAQAKENLVRLFDGARRASETARIKVAAAGVPDVEGGADVAREFERSLSGARDAYHNAQTTIDHLSTGDATAFYDAVAAALSTLNTEYGQSALDTTRLRSAALQRAFDEVPECR